jgi:hypothetical protein
MKWFQLHRFPDNCVVVTAAAAAAAADADDGRSDNGLHRCGCWQLNAAPSTELKDDV